MEDEFAAFYASAKEIAAYPVTWRPGNGPRSLSLSAPLAVGGIVAEGFSLKAKTLIDLPDRNITMVLDYSDPSGYGKGIQVAKAEWKPVSGHNNKGWGPPEWRYIEQRDSHIHCFEDNFSLGGNVWKKKQLPLALPISPDPSSFEEFLEFVAEKFRIPNVYLVPKPPWDPQWQPELQLS